MTDLATLLVEDALQHEKIEIAKNMLKDKLPLSAIEKYTGLDISTIKELQEKINNE